MLHRAGDVFGRAVNHASRLTDHAPAGAVLCDLASRDALVEEGQEGLVLQELEPVEFKGVDAPQRVFAVSRRA